MFGIAGFHIIRSDVNPIRYSFHDRHRKYTITRNTEAYRQSVQNQLLIL
jgi:hypothetical protein